MCFFRRQQVFSADERIVITTILVGVLVIIGMMCAMAIRQSLEHQRFLEEHGCQLLTEAPTGRTVYCGRGCNRPEKVYVYECAKGTLTEVR